MRKRNRALGVHGRMQASSLLQLVTSVQFSVVPQTESEKAKIVGSVSVNTTHVAGIDLRRLLLQATTNLNSEQL